MKACVLDSRLRGNDGKKCGNDEERRCRDGKAVCDKKSMGMMKTAKGGSDERSEGVPKKQSEGMIKGVRE